MSDKEEAYWEAKREEISKSLIPHHFTADAAWFLACLAVDIERLKEVKAL